MGSEIIFEVWEDETEGGFVARALGHSIVTQADTWEELRTNVREAVACHFDPGTRPKLIRLHRTYEELLGTTTRSNLERCDRFLGKLPGTSESRSRKS